LLPQIPHSFALEMAERHATSDVADLAHQASNRHEKQVFSSTGGNQVSASELDELARAVRQVRDAHRPTSADGPLVRVLHPWMNLSRHEASLEGVWAFLACVLLPDVVRWRFPGEKTPADRFLGGGRGLRNVFGRAWWRGELLFDESPPAGRDAYWLTDALSEDEIIGIVERPRAVATRTLAVALARALLQTKCGEVPRMQVAREGLKQLLRLGYFVEFDALQGEELRVACESLFRRSVMRLSPLQGAASPLP
jgi:hypothetical protein